MHLSGPQLAEMDAAIDSAAPNTSKTTTDAQLHIRKWKALTESG